MGIGMGMLLSRPRPNDESNPGNRVAERLIELIQMLVSTGFSWFVINRSRSKQEDFVLLIM